MLREVLLGLLLVSLCLADCPCASTNLSCEDGRTPSTGTLALYTHDGVTGKPFGARVACEFQYDRREANSDASTGLVFLTGLKPGRHTCAAMKPGYAFSTVEINIQAGVHSTATLTLSRIIGTVRGKVVDSLTEKSLSGVALSCVGSDNSTFSATSDANGNFVLNNVRSSTVSCTGARAGYDSPRTTFYIAGLVSNGRLALTPRSGSLSGTVTDAAGAFLARAVVVCNGPTEGRAVVTGANGAFQFNNLNGGSYACSVYKYQHRDLFANVTVAAGQPTTATFALTAAPTTLYGGVTDTANNQPLSSATVSCGAWTATTGANGGFTLNVNATSVTCTASLNGYSSSSRTFQVSPGTMVYAGFQLTPSTRTLRGKIVSVDSLHHVSDASINCYDLEGRVLETSVEADGSFSLQRRKRGEFKCVASADGFEDSHAVAEFDDEVNEFKISLSPAASEVTVTALDAETGAVVPSSTVTCHIQTSGGREMSVTRVADAKGQVSLFNIRVSGVISCTTSAHGFSESKPVSSDITPGSYLDLKALMASAPAVVEGMVVTNAKVPVPGSTVRCFQKGQPVLGATTDEKGAFRFENVYRGEWTCFVSANNYERSTVKIQVAQGELNIVHFALGTTLAEATFEVIDSETSEPVPLATVSLSSSSNPAIVINDITTDVKGLATFSLPADSYVVRVNARDYLARFTTAFLRGTNIKVPVRIKKEVIDVHGTVVDAATGEVIANAAVSIAIPGSTKIITELTNAQGIFHFSRVVPGSYIISATASFYSHTAHMRTIDKSGKCLDCHDGALSLSLYKLPKAAEIVGTINTFGSSEPLGSMFVEVRSLSDQTVFTSSVNADGKFTIPVARTGTYQIVPHSGFWEAEPQEVVVEHLGEKYEMTFTVIPRFFERQD